MNKQNTTVDFAGNTATMNGHNVEALTNYQAKRAKFERRQKTNARYRHTSRGWLRNYYSRLKKKGHDATTFYTSEEFVRVAEATSSFLAAWSCYADEGFKKSFAPRLGSFTDEASLFFV